MLCFSGLVQILHLQRSRGWSIRDNVDLPHQTRPGFTQPHLSAFLLPTSAVRGNSCQLPSPKSLCCPVKPCKEEDGEKTRICCLCFSLFLAPTSLELPALLPTHPAITAKRGSMCSHITGAWLLESQTGDGMISFSHLFWQEGEQ